MNLTPQSQESEMPKKVPLVIEGATPALGQASQAIKFGNMLFVSGQLPVNPETNKIAGNDIASQTEACIKSLETIADFIGGALSNIIKVTIYVTDMKDLKEMEKVYMKYFNYQPPVRTIVEVSRLPMNARIQMDVVIFPPVRETKKSAF